MNASRGAVWGVALLVIVTSVLTGPAVSGPDVTRTPPTFGEGDATVASVDLPDTPALDRGRYGTAVLYLRGPTALVTARDVRGAPRLVLRVQAPALDFEESATVVLREGERGTRRLAIADSVLDANAVPSDPVTVRTTVRIQSFTADRTVYDVNHTVGGDR